MFNFKIRVIRSMASHQAEFGVHAAGHAHARERSLGRGGEVGQKLSSETRKFGCEAHWVGVKPQLDDALQTTQPLKASHLRTCTQVGRWSQSRGALR